MLQTSEQPKYMKQQLAELKKEIDSNKIGEYFNIPFSIMVELEKINKNMVGLKNTVDKFDLKDIPNTPSNNSRINILLECIQYILQDRSCLATKQVLATLSDCNHIKYLY